MSLSPIVAFLLGWITSAAVALAVSYAYDAVTTPRATKTNKDQS